MNWRRTFGSCCSLPVAAALAACATDAPPGAPMLAVHGAWARAADSGASTAVYFVLENRDSLPDTLHAARSGAAEMTQIHISMQQGGMMHMHELPALPVPARDSVSFRPLGAHVMLMRLGRRLAADDTVAVTLEFVSGRTLEVRAGVRQP